MAAKNDGAIKVAARYGDAWFPSPNMSLDVSKQRLQVYRNEIKAAGRDTPQEFPIFRECYVAKTNDEALMDFKKPLMYTQRKYWEWRERIGWEGKEVEWDEDAFFEKYQEMYLIGSPDEVISKAEK